MEQQEQSIAGMNGKSLAFFRRPYSLVDIKLWLL